MPRPRTANTTRSHHRKSAPPAPELEALVDTIADGMNPDEVEQPISSPRPRAQKAGPKKVLNETQKIIGDGLAVGVVLVAQNPDARKSITMPEAQSIAHPIVRMVGRRLPGWMKPYLPKTKLSPDDAADIEEILVTMGKWGMRLVTVMVTDFIEGREKAQAERQQQRATGEGTQRPITPTVGVQAEQREAVAAAVQPSPNGHNPAFDVLASIDLGFSGE